MRSVAMACGIGLCAALFQTGCESETTPQTAKGDTPIRYVICNSHGTNCFVSARFSDLKNCELHKEVNGALCDRTSSKGRIVCNTAHRSELTSSYCTL